MKIKLVHPNLNYKTNILDSLEQLNIIDKPNGPIPGSSNINGYSTIEEWLEFINTKDTETVLVPFLQYIALNEQNDVVGFLNIRLSLNEHLINYGGHIGYCVTPKFRNQGIADQLLKEAIKICKEHDISDILITCKESNLYSEKVIIKNNGILEDIRNDGCYNFKRYWIKS
ncbi:GNAT family N-acetyltransferase [Spiroplasma monobiae]|uniref:GNAT family acetyltransferase n=1 Tax=Spiroplasma monobiae MQ-1 TaxID=1336748 RepID=A0A2K9LUA3_SPISQ|nr:GNAT family N-acetyltransferase [Spiroplasma monobiae]AUM62638.1 GNAT family acetyltransferase [Spiroplasma monobiae MQ-1]